MSEYLEKSHPRYESIRIRELLTGMVEKKVVAPAGLIAHGRGEAFDYLIGERSPECTAPSIEAAAAALLSARGGVISINGNVAALCPEALVELAEASGAALEINLFYRTRERIDAIAEVMRNAGAKELLGVDEEEQTSIEEIGSQRKRVDRRGIYRADTVFVPLEDGDRTEALAALGKRVITVDLNPLSRTSRMASISIMDNIIRAVPAITDRIRQLSSLSTDRLEAILQGYNNQEVLASCRRSIADFLVRWGEES